MIVLVALEWVRDKGKHYTQLSALRTDAEWNVAASFNAIIDPGEAYRNMTENVFLGGISTQLYQNGVSEKICVRQFEEWLQPEDELWVGAKAVRTALKELWFKYAVRLQPQVRLLSNVPKATFPKMLYEELRCRGEEVPQPECRAENDAEVMRRVLCLPEMQHMRPSDSDAATLANRRQSNREWAERTNFNFIYLRNSEVFHRKNCALWTAAESKSALLGCADYATAVKKRRPCKCCKPEPILTEVRQKNLEWAMSTNYNYIYLKNSPIFHRRDCPLWTSAQNRKELLGSATYEAAAKNRQPCEHCRPVPLFAPDTAAAAPQTKKQQTKNQPDTQIFAHMISGDTIIIKWNNIVGWCHNKTHIGCINKSLYLSHDCEGKNCSFFEPNTDSKYLKAKENKKKHKQNINEQRRREKQIQAQEAERLDALRDLWQTYADDLCYNIRLVRIAAEADDAYRVFFVSDNNYADENHYSKLIARVRTVNPKLHICLRHIRDTDGHFVTTPEFMRRRAS